MKSDQAAASGSSRSVRFPGAPKRSSVTTHPPSGTVQLFGAALPGRPVIEPPGTSPIRHHDIHGCVTVVCRPPPSPRRRGDAGVTAGSARSRHSARRSPGRPSRQVRIRRIRDHGGPFMTGTSERPQVGTQQPVPSPRTPQEPGVTSDLPRVLTNLHHGDHVAGEDVSTVTPKPDLGDAVEWAKVKKTSTPFGYMFDDLRGQYPGAHLPTEPSAAVVACLKALGTAMVEQPDDPATADSTTPPIYTYWGQFVDHD